MAFPVFMTFSKTINNSESAPDLTDLLEGQSIGPKQAISRQSARRRFTPAFVSQIPQNVGGLGAFKFSSLLTVQAGRRFNVFADSDANGDGALLSDRPAWWAATRSKGWARQMNQRRTLRLAASPKGQNQRRFLCIPHPRDLSC